MKHKENRERNTFICIISGALFTTFCFASFSMFAFCFVFLWAFSWLRCSLSPQKNEKFSRSHFHGLLFISRTHSFRIVYFAFCWNRILLFGCVFYQLYCCIEREKIVIYVFGGAVSGEMLGHRTIPAVERSISFREFDWDSGFLSGYVPRVSPHRINASFMEIFGKWIYTTICLNTIVLGLLRYYHFTSLCVTADYHNFWHFSAN